jgi:hypothetical protein
MRCDVLGQLHLLSCAPWDVLKRIRLMLAGFQQEVGRSTICGKDVSRRGTAGWLQDTTEDVLPGGDQPKLGSHHEG